jgi:hypothetical protein
MAQSPDERGCVLVAPGAHRHDDELVTADPGDGVALAQHGLEASGEDLQHVVPGPVAADVVHVLEAVEIDGDHRERLS